MGQTPSMVHTPKKEVSGKELTHTRRSSFGKPETDVKPSVLITYVITSRKHPSRNHTERLLMPQYMVNSESICEVYSELCSRIYEHDRCRGLTMSNERETDIYLWIRPFRSRNNCGKSLNTEFGMKAPKCHKLKKPRSLIKWMLQNHDWQEQLVAGFWDLPRGTGGFTQLPWFTLEAEYRRNARNEIYKDHQVGLESRGITLDMFDQTQAKDRSIKDRNIRLTLGVRESAVEEGKLIVRNGDILGSDGSVIVRNGELVFGNGEVVNGDGYMIGSGSVPVGLAEITVGVQGITPALHGVFVNEGSNPLDDRTNLNNYQSILERCGSVTPEPGMMTADFGESEVAGIMGISYKMGSFGVRPRNVLVEVTEIFGNEV